MAARSSLTRGPYFVPRQNRVQVARRISASSDTPQQRSFVGDMVVGIRWPLALVGRTKLSAKDGRPEGTRRSGGARWWRGRLAVRCSSYAARRT